VRKIQVFIREDQKAGLRTLSARTGMRQSDLVRRSVDLLLENAAQKKSDWREATRAAAGLWRSHDDAEAAGQKLRQSLKKRFAAYGRE
jgi:hypothetical protein